jgi:hypothetical protein
MTIKAPCIVIMCKPNNELRRRRRR